MKLPIFSFFTIMPLCLAMLPPSLRAQEGATPSHGLVGDVGVGISVAPTAARSSSAGHAAIPYANFDYGAGFARIDTFGIKLAPVGYGSVELLTRVLDDGYTPAEGAGLLERRKSSMPLGVGTLQTTPAGAFMANFYRDAGKSSGTLVDLLYAAQIEYGGLALYPQAGLEYRSAAYIRYYDGVSPGDGPRSGLPAYVPGAASNLYAALFMEARISGHWYVNGNLRRTWLDSSVSASPLVRRHVLDSGLLALSYRFD